MSALAAARPPLMPMGRAIDAELQEKIGWISAFFLTAYRHMGPCFRYLRDGAIYSVLAGSEANQLANREGRRLIRAEPYRREQNRELGSSDRWSASTARSTAVTG
jgi:hypothetical protein